MIPSKIFYKQKYQGLLKSSTYQIIDFLKSLKKKVILKIQEELSLELSDLSVWYFISFTFGCACFYSTSQIQIKSAFILNIFLSFSLLLYFYYNKFGIRFFILLFLFFIFGFIVGMFHKSQSRDYPIKEQLTLHLQGKVESIIQSNKGAKIVLSTIQILDNLNKPSKSFFKTNQDKIRLNIKKKYFSHLEKGDVIQILACINSPSEELVPGGYNFNFYSKLQNIHAIGSALSRPKVVKKKYNHWSAIRQKIYNSLIKYMSPVQANFMAAILLGDPQNIDQKVMQNIRFSGISHILCISGLHLSLVTLICYKALRFILNISDYLSYNKNIKAIAGVLSITVSYCYLLLSGSQIAATRAFIMCLSASLATLLGRNYSPTRALGIASFVILLLKPGYATHPSFQLSFLAVLSLIYGYEFYQKLQRNLCGSSQTKQSLTTKFSHYLYANLYTSFIVGIGTTPIVAYHFYTISNYSPLTNLIAVPITSLILMPGAFLFLFLLVFHSEKYLLKFIGYFIDIIINLSSFIANLNRSVTYTGFVDQTGVVLHIIGFLLLMICKSKLKYLGLLIMLYASIIMLTSKKPDLILDINKKAIGFKNAEGQLEICSGSNLSNFTKNNWASWFGSESFIIRQIPDSTISFKTKYNKVIDIVFKDLNYNPNSKIVIHYPQNICMSSNFSKIQKFQQYRFMLIFCNKQNCRVKFYN